ncbi:hypothetical protein GGR52DRAFT_45161 [Hypoxylon sp. FL1284]|nr:hypothetical protein GGR52DRAFT_45161 [Hypoxylon sp. FL1284]
MKVSSICIRAVLSILDRQFQWITPLNYFPCPRALWPSRRDHKPCALHLEHIMANDTLPQSLNFLTDAAHLLATTAPETSAYLMSRRSSLMFNNGLEQPDVQKQHVCNACGHIMIPGQGSELKLESDKTAQKRRRAKRPHAPKDLGEQSPLAVGCRKRITCGLCRRHTDIRLPPPAPISRRRPMKVLQPSSSGTARPGAMAPPPEPGKVSANASRKKRAKNRKQGLQALLQQAQSAPKPQNGLGLSLSDFMMK